MTKATGASDVLALPTAVISLSAEGTAIARYLLRGLAGELFVHVSVPRVASARRFERLIPLAKELFPRYRRLVFVAPCGAVVRAIASSLRHKTVDPAVVVVDAAGRHVISLVSGHEGGANELAFEIANRLGAEPVVTTTTDSLKDVIVGVGCRRGASASSIKTAVGFALARAGISPARVRAIASVDLKADEEGLRAAARELGVPLRLIASDDIRSTCRSFSRSEVAERRVGLPAVAEPAALLAGRRTRLVLQRQVVASVTVAIAREGSPSWELARATHSTGRSVPKRPSGRAR